jgi:fatty acid desaturase
LRCAAATRARAGLRWLNGVAPQLLAPFFGLPPWTYRLHHCVIHHGGGNAHPSDVSSTEPYRRDSAAHFACYWARFALAAWAELPLWALRARRRGLAARAALGVGLQVAAFYAAAAVNPVAARWLVAAPFALSSLLLMFGNFAQHAFLNPDAPRSPLGAAYTCINHADNQATFNDGYHAGHHANARMHWSELPASFMASLPAHGAADALVFHGAHFFEIGVAVVLCGERGLRWLARRTVALPGAPRRSEAEWVAELRRRLAPVRIAAADDAKAA